MSDFLKRDWNLKSECKFIASRRHAAVLLTKAFLRSTEMETKDESPKQADSDRAAKTKEKCYGWQLSEQQETPELFPGVSSDSALSSTSLPI